MDKPPTKDQIQKIASIITENIDMAAPAAPPRPKTAPPKPATKPAFKPFNPPRPAKLPKPKAEDMAAPAAPPRPKTAPPKPATKPAFKPFNPPRPAKLPKPKAKSSKYLKESYEEGVNPSTQQFWGNIRQQEHPYAKHPLMAMYGPELAKKAYKHSVDRLKKIFPELANSSPRQFGAQISSLSMRVLTAIQEAEEPHLIELEDLAINLVHKLFGIPKDMLNANIVQSVEMSDDDWDEEGDYDEENDDEDVDSSEINKRITMNALTQGSAVHSMMTIHHMAAREIEAIDPNLLKLYDQISSGAEHMYWLIDIVAMASHLKNSVAGLAEVEYEGDDQEQEQGQGQPTVYAQAMCFPVLVQELIKGTMEVLSHHGLSKFSKGQIKKIEDAAGRLEDEPWLIQIGPQLWRAFLKIVPKGSQLATVVAKIAQQEPAIIHDILSKTVEAIQAEEDPAEQREILRDMINEIEEETDYDIT